MKRTTIISSMLALTMALATPLYAEGRTIAGADIGVMIPHDDLGDAVYVGGIFSPFVGYMFNPYFGVMGQAQVWFGKTEETGPTHDDNTTWAAAGLAGPRLAIPFNRGEFYATAQGGIATSLADEAITDTSPAFSAGAGLNFTLRDNWMLGVFGRWNHLYQRVHGTGDAKYITTGLALTYNFAAEAPPPPPPPPAPRAEAPAPAPRMEKKIVLRGVNFDFDKSNIRADARPILDEAIAMLKQEGSITIVTEGHTDAVGSDQYNQKLSVRRATAVKDYLVRGGISSSRIEIQGFGESKPVASNATADGRAQNRRVELRVNNQ